MKYSLPFLLAACLILVLPAHAQQNDADEDARHNLAIFEPLDLHGPNDYRAGSGEPGADYWQQQADYDIDISLNPASHRVEGQETITYTNNSPHELQRLWLQLDQNLFDPESRGARITGANDRFRGAFEGGGYEISNVSIQYDGKRYEPEYVIDDTKMRVMLEEPLPAKTGQLEISLDFAFTIPDYGADRMGRLGVEQGTVYQLAQWFPRMYTFDDVSGWNVLPYLGQGEWYLEYGTYDLSITVPHDYIVRATGTLENPGEVLTDEQQQRLDRARGSDETVRIIRPEEVGTPASRPDGDGPLTWEYHAEDVRDVAWTASPAFIWDAAAADVAGREVLVESVYPREGVGTKSNPGWERSTQYVQHSIEFYSQWEPYPYPVATNVAGIVAGMEYPQIVFCSVQARGRGLFGVTDHEIGHEWFPMMVGSDERRHAWMDEGLNTFMNYYSTRAFYENVGEGRMSGDYVARGMQSDIADQPIFTYADRIRGAGLGFLAYRKPAKGLVLLREYILGPELFDPAFRAYIDRWAYKHPQPADFFRTIEDVSGEDLDWFWRGWFMTTYRFDQALQNVTVEDDASTITIENQARQVMPTTLELTYEDGSTERRRIPVEAYYTSDTFSLTVPRAVERVRLDPEGMLPDIDRTDDAWQQGEGITAPSGSS